MALPLSGPISLSEINVELSRPPTSTLSLNDSVVRSLFGVLTGPISLSNGHGKTTNEWLGTITTHQKEMNLATWALANGWNGSSHAVITVAAGVYIYSDNVAIPAMTTGQFPGGLTLVVSGYIMGKGGKGGSVYYSEGSENWIPPEAGGVALSLLTTTKINLNGGYIAGGGGGGGAGGSALNPSSGGGGAGGGASGDVINLSDGTYNVWGSAGGGLGAVGNNGIANVWGGGGGGGGRILPGNGGAARPVADGYKLGGLGGGAGGSGGVSIAGTDDKVYAGTASGGGGGWGAPGGAGCITYSYYSSGASGAGGSGSGAGSNAYVSSSTYTQYGGAGGKAIATNGFSVTWLSGTTTVFGVVG